MNVLFDTHVFIRLDSSPEKLSPAVLEICQDAANTLHLSIASIWEMQIKQQLGKLNLKMPLNRLLEEQRIQNGLQILPITLDHIYALSELPLHHKDPFDRLIIAQAKLENFSLASVDEHFRQYDVDLFW